MYLHMRICTYICVCLCMYVVGLSLVSASAHTVFTLKEILQIGISIAYTLSHIHNAHIIHKDLSLGITYVYHIYITYMSYTYDTLLACMCVCLCLCVFVCIVVWFCCLVLFWKQMLVLLTPMWLTIQHISYILLNALVSLFHATCCTHILAPSNVCIVYSYVLFWHIQYVISYMINAHSYLHLALYILALSTVCIVHSYMRWFWHIQ